MTVQCVTDKFGKHLTYVLGKSTWTAQEWAITLLDRFYLSDWGILKVLLSDRDPKFLSELWKAIFDKLGVKLLYLTAYHRQTDSSSERTNQTAEIALQFYMHTLEDASTWLAVLPCMQALLNNAQSSTTNKSPNKISYRFQLNRPLDLLASDSLLQQEHTRSRVEITDAISFAQMSQKFYYN